MTEHKSYTDYVAKQREQMLSICQSMIEGKTGIVEGCRKIRGFGPEIGLDDNDADILAIVGVDSATDHLPIDDERNRCASEALAKSDIEINECEEQFDYDIDICAPPMPMCTDNIAASSFSHRRRRGDECTTTTTTDDDSRITPQQQQQQDDNDDDAPDDYSSSVVVLVCVFRCYVVVVYVLRMNRN